MTQLLLYLVFSLLTVNAIIDPLGTTETTEPNHPDPSAPGTDTSWKDPDPDLTVPHSSRVKRDVDGKVVIPLAQEESTTNSATNSTENATSSPDLSTPNLNGTSGGLALSQKQNLTAAEQAIIDASNNKNPPLKVETTTEEYDPRGVHRFEEEEEEEETPVVDVVKVPPLTAADNVLTEKEFTKKMSEYHENMVERCMMYSDGVRCYSGNDCPKDSYDQETGFSHQKIIQARHNSLQKRPERLDRCNLIAKFEPTDREAHFSLELEISSIDADLPFKHDGVKFRVVNGRLTCTPNCTMSATKPIIFYVDEAIHETFYYFKTDFFKWKNKKRADLKWCLQQVPSVCHVGNFCASGSTFTIHNRNTFLYNSLRKKILANPNLTEVAENCNVGAVMTSTDEKGRSLIDYHTTESNILKPILPTYYGIHHPIYVEENNTLVCAASFCTVNTFYSKSYREDGMNFLFFTGELITTAEKPGKGNASSLAKGEKKEKEEELDARPAWGILGLIVIFVVLVVVVLAVVAGVMYQRYQKAKTKHREALIQARIKAEPARSSRKEVTPLVRETPPTDDLISEKSALDRSFKD